MAVKNKSSELKIVRIYDAPVDKVWDAWTDPVQTAQWWGPRGFTTTTHSKELKPGGRWIYTMHSPDGVDYKNTTTYLEVEKHKKLVYDHGGGEDSKPMFRVTVLFSKSKGKTHMDMTMTLPTPEAAEQTRRHIKQAGGDATWDRLAEYMEKQSAGKETFVINRTFDAPIDLMFKMWTEEKHLQSWLAPAGFKMDYIRSGIAEGGSTFYSMSGPGDAKMYGRAEYIEIKKPDRIVYTQQFCDENEKITRHPMSPTWPETMKTTVQLTAESPEQTRVTITWECEGKISAEELETFVKARGGMTQGWTGSLDKLDEYIGEAKIQEL